MAPRSWYNAPSLIEVSMQVNDRKIRFRSMRGYRRQIDELIARASRGELAWSDVASGTSAIKSAAEILMAENLAKLNDVSDMELDHALGQDGGYDEYDPNGRAKVFKKHKRVLTQGVNAKGETVNMEQITVEGDEEAITGEYWFKTEWDEEPE